ncbi:unnamed protein product [Didymodactylos carnosus]|uniref:Uncharacterized protein n=1 Tax=Didymodactylos carnosus TaxID=1234261 RepID=A0A814VVH6_9BILA|nr:unnamed protein product [Didymodactylos carnosus]CAF3957372.1 unnamed protein product [Didymodactylos carnosus]
MSDKGLVTSQINKVMKALHPDESADTFRTLFRCIQQWASAVNNQAYTISHVMADGSPASRLMLLTWSTDAELNDFSQYFQQNWVSSLPYWYEGVVSLAPSTNNGLNGRIKKDYTLRNRLSLSTFLKTAERMLIDWSTDSGKKPFQLRTTYKDHLKFAAYTWLQQVRRVQTPFYFKIVIFYFIYYVADGD